MRFILIVLLFVKPIIAAFGNAERDMLFGGELPLTMNTVFERFKAQRIFAAFQKKIGHEKFKHRPRPRERAGVAARARHHPRERAPVLFGHLPRGDGVIAHHARFAHQKVIVRVAEHVFFEVITDIKQILPPIVKRRKVARCPQSVRPRAHVPQFRALRGVFRKPFGKRGQAAEKIAAVHGRNEPRRQRFERLGVIPVKQIPVPARQFFHAV